MALPPDPLLDRIRRRKDILFRPITAWLDRRGITPGALSGAGALTAASGLAVAIYSSNPLFFLVGIWLHVVCDGFDGSLARYKHRADKRGEMIDVAADYFGVLTIVVYSQFFTPLSEIAALLLVALYGLSSWRSLQHESYPFVVRSRLMIYAAATIDYFLQSTVFAPSVWLSIVALVVAALNKVIAVVQQRAHA